MVRPALPYLVALALAAVAHAQTVERTYRGTTADSPEGKSGLMNPDRGYRLELQLGVPEGAYLATGEDGKAGVRRGPLAPGSTPFAHLGLDPAKPGWGDRPTGAALARWRLADVTTHLALVWLDPADKPLPPATLGRIYNGLETTRRAGSRLWLRLAYEMDRTKSGGPSVATAQAHLKALAPLLRDHADALAGVQLGIIGHRGEVRAATRIPESAADHAAILKAVLDARPKGKAVLVRTPAMRAGLLQELKLAPSVGQGEAFDGMTVAGMVGFHNIGFGHDATDDGTFDAIGNQDADWRTWSEQAIWVPADVDLGPGARSSQALTDGWQVARRLCAERAVTLGVAHAWSAADPAGRPGPVDGWKSQLKSREEVVALGLPVSDGYFEDAKGAPVSRSAFDYIRDHLGYRLELRNASWPAKVKAGNAYVMNLSIANRGFASCPVPRMLDLAYVPKSGQPIYAAGQGESFDMRKALPSHLVRGPDNEEGLMRITVNTFAPTVPGKYQVALLLREFDGDPARTLGESSAVGMLRRHNLSRGSRTGSGSLPDPRLYIRFANRDLPHWGDSTGAGPLIGEIEVTR